MCRALIASSYFSEVRNSSFSIDFRKIPSRKRQNLKVGRIGAERGHSGSTDLPEREMSVEWESHSVRTILSTGAYFL